MEKVATEVITINKKEYDELLEDCHFLACLRTCGVDNWEGYGEAQELMETAELGEEEE